MKQIQTVVPQWLFWLLLGTFILVSGIVLALMVRTAEAILYSPFNPLANEPVAEMQVDEALLPPAVTISSAEMTAMPAVALPELPPLEEAQINVLVMGIDRRPGEPFVARTDTMLLLSVDTERETASMLSIPRDLWVEIPGIGVNRINTAFLNGARGGNPTAGAELAMATVQRALGVPVEHYLLIDFQAVTNLIDSLGGVTVDVPVAIYDPTYPDMNYGYDPLTVPAGVQTMDGNTALKYMRTRHGDSDFGRARRQQQVLMGLRDEALSLGMGSLLLRAPALYRDVSEGIFTDLTLDQLLTIANTASGIPQENIETAVLDYTYVQSWTSPGGGSVLRLRPDAVQPLIDRLYGPRSGS